MKLFLYLISFCAFCIACSPYKISRVGYQNLRQVVDTACDVTIERSKAPSSDASKLGKLSLTPNPLNKHSSLAEATTLIKQEACAINANKVYVIKESYQNENKGTGYVCTVELYREVKKSNAIPDFVRRAKDEVEIAKRQKKKMEEGRERQADTVPLEEGPVLELNDILLTELKDYSHKDTVTTASVAESVPMDFSADKDSSHFVSQKSLVSVEPVEEKEKLKKGVFASIGPLYGGTIGFGTEIEFAISRFGIWAGGGVFGHGAGLTLHMKPDPISSYISVHYYKTGFDYMYMYNMVGASYNYRAKRWFTARIGAGKVFETAASYSYGDIIPVFAIGAYVPF